MKIMKQQAPLNPKNASKVNAAESRWERFVKAGPPPEPVKDQRPQLSFRGADSARRVMKLVEVGIDPLFEPFSDEIHFDERIGFVGSNGTGKTHLLDEPTDNLDVGAVFDLPDDETALAALTDPDGIYDLTLAKLSS